MLGTGIILSLSFVPTSDSDTGPQSDQNSQEQKIIRCMPCLLSSPGRNLCCSRFGLAMFPLPRSDMPEGNSFSLGATGHMVYNILMCCSFSTNVVVTVSDVHGLT